MDSTYVTFLRIWWIIEKVFTLVPNVSVRGGYLCDGVRCALMGLHFPHCQDGNTGICSGTPRLSLSHSTPSESWSRRQTILRKAVECRRLKRKQAGTLPWMATNIWKGDCRGWFKSDARAGLWRMAGLGSAIHQWAVELLHPHRQSATPTRDVQRDASLILLSGWWGFQLSTQICWSLPGSFVNRKSMWWWKELAQASCRLGDGSSRLILVGWPKSIERKVHFHNVSFGWRQGKWGKIDIFF